MATRPPSLALAPPLGAQQLHRLLRAELRAGAVGAVDAELRLQAVLAPLDLLEGRLPELDDHLRRLARGDREPLRAEHLAVPLELRLALASGAGVTRAGHADADLALAADAESLARLDLGERPLRARLALARHRVALARVVLDHAEVLQRAPHELRPRRRVHPFEPEPGVHRVAGPDDAALGELLHGAPPVGGVELRAGRRRRRRPPTRVGLEVGRVDDRPVRGDPDVVDPRPEAERPPVRDHGDEQLDLLADVRAQVDREVLPPLRAAGERVPRAGRAGRFAGRVVVVQQERVQGVGAVRQPRGAALAGLVGRQAARV